MNPEVLNFYFNVDGDYARFIGDLRAKLADHPERDHYINKFDPLLKDHPLLPVQRHPPTRWMHINLIVQDEDGVGTKGTTIAVRGDNVYFIGFKNRHDKWYEFGIEGENARLLEGSTFLGCHVRYGDLVGSEGLVNLDLGKEAMTRVVLRLWAYQHVGPADAATRRDFVRLSFMICEAARMVPLCETVGGDGWCVGSRFEQQHVDYIRAWRKMSEALIKCALNDPQKLTTLKEFNVVYLVLNRRKVEGTWQHWSFMSSARGRRSQMTGAIWRPTSSSGGRGAQEQEVQTGGMSVRPRPLVEVFSVEADFGVIVGTIAVFDGKRGQIIYKNDHQPQSQGSRYRDKLALTGPYKAISADGSFTIQVYGITSGTVIGEMFWDCYADDYNEVLTRDIISTDTGGRLAEVKYAVWSEAVEATVEVNLLLPGITHVYGKISTYTKISRSNEVVLFNREPDEKVELAPSSVGSMVPLELRRSVIALELNSSSAMWIYVDLRVATPNNESGVLLSGEVRFYPKKQTGEIYIRQYGDIFVPVGSDPTGVGVASSASHQGTEQTSEQRVKVQVNMTSPGFHASPV